MRVSVGGPFHEDLGMRAMLWECEVRVEVKGSVNMSVVAVGVQFHCGMHC